VIVRRLTDVIANVLGLATALVACSGERGTNATPAAPSPDDPKAIAP
jgi:hypothetical protein